MQRVGNSRMRRYVLSALAVVYLAALVYVVAGFEHSRLLLTLSWTDFAVLSILSLATTILNGLFLKVACHALGCQIAKIEAVGLASANSLLNYLPLRVGLGFKAAYLASVRGLSVSGFASITGVSAAMTFVCAGVLGASISLWQWQFSEPRQITLGVLGALYGATAVLGATLILGGAGLKRLRLPWGLSRFSAPLSGALSTLTRDMAFQFQTYGLNLAILMVVAARLYFVSLLVDAPVTLSEAILLSTAAAVAVFVSILPAGLGVREAALSATYVVLGGSLETGLLLSTIDRIVSLFWAIIVGSVWLWASRHQIGGLASNETVEG